MHHFFQVRQAPTPRPRSRYLSLVNVRLNNPCINNLFCDPNMVYFSYYMCTLVIICITINCQ